VEFWRGRQNSNPCKRRFPLRRNATPGPPWAIDRAHPACSPASNFAVPRKYDESRLQATAHWPTAGCCPRGRGALSQADPCAVADPPGDRFASRAGAERPHSAGLSHRRSVRGAGTRDPASIHSWRQGGRRGEDDERGPILDQAEGRLLRREGARTPGRDGADSTGGQVSRGRIARVDFHLDTGIQ
jgi:hypothetical protein